MNKTRDCDLERIKRLVEAMRYEEGALLPILHSIQDHEGFIPIEAIPLIAKALRQTPAEIHGVISFYHQFRTAPAGKHHLQICRAEACQARGGRALENRVKTRLGIDYHETTADAEITLSPIYCLGLCATGPNIRLDDTLLGHVSNEHLDRTLQQLLEPES